MASRAGKSPTGGRSRQTNMGSNKAKGQGVNADPHAKMKKGGTGGGPTRGRSASGKDENTGG